MLNISQQPINTFLTALNFIEFQQKSNKNMSQKLITQLTNQLQKDFIIQTNNNPIKANSVNDENQNEEGDSLQLMVRAHQRIRTLEDDNQILRMHIELLSKDNKQLLKNVEKMESQKKATLKQNQELKKRIKQLQVKVIGGRAKQELENLQKQEDGHSYYPSKWIERANKLKISYDINKKEEISTTLQATQQKRSEIKTNNQNYTIKRSQTEENVQSNKNQCDFGTYKSTSYQKISPYSQLLLKRAEQRRMERNFSHKIFSSYQPRDCRDYTPKNRQMNLITNNSNLLLNSSQIMNKPLNSTHDSFDLTSKPIRANSPLIRKNSLSKQKPNVQFQNRPQPNCPPHYQSPLAKKFNYTNWRKTNNNLMVWRMPTTSTANKSILIKR